MNRIDHQKILHELSQPYIQMAASSLSNHLDRNNAGAVTRIMFDSMLQTLKDKNALVTQLYEEIDRLKAVAQ